MCEINMRSSVFGRFRYPQSDKHKIVLQVLSMLALGSASEHEINILVFHTLTQPCMSCASENLL